MKRKPAPVTAVFVEGGVALADVLEALAAEVPAGPVTVVCANFVDEKALDQALAQDPALARNVELYGAALPRPDVDSETWTYARLISTGVSNGIRRALRSGGQRQKIALVASFQERCDDIVYRYVRPATHFRRLVQSNGSYHRVVALTSRKQVAANLIDALSDEPEAGHVAEWLSGLPGRLATVSARRHILAGSGPVKRSAIRSPQEANRGPLPVPQPKGPTDILLVTHTRDPLYRASLAPLVKSLVQDYSVGVWGVNSRAADRPEHAEPFEAVGANVDFIALESLQPPSPEVAALLDAEFSKMEVKNLRYFGGCPAPLVRYALSMTLRTMPATFGYVEAVAAGAAAMLDKGVKTVVVAPGRLLESRILAREARARKITVIEPQLGTWSDSPKFLPPLANHVLAQDVLGQRIFTDHFGMDEASVTLVGTPKTDQVVHKYLNLAKPKARRKLGLDSDGGLIVFASQPFADEIMKPIVSVVLATAKALGVTARLLLHHREGEERARLYASMIRKQGLSDLVEVVAAGQVFEYIRAADVFMTYCSGSGAEAFALRRPVIVLNPHKTPIPLDLVESGVGDMARNLQETIAMVEHFLARPRSYLPISRTFQRETELTVQLADGAAMTRMRETIARAANEASLAGSRRARGGAHAKAEGRFRKTVKGVRKKIRKMMSSMARR